MSFGYTNWREYGQHYFCRISVSRATCDAVRGKVAKRKELHPEGVYLGLSPPPPLWTIRLSICSFYPPVSSSLPFSLTPASETDVPLRSPSEAPSSTNPLLPSKSVSTLRGDGMAPPPKTT